MDTSMTSPLTMNRGGSNPIPTPAGVPVAMMSPGRSVIPADNVAISSGMSKIRSLTGADCRGSPLTWLSACSAVTSATSSAVTA